MTRAAEKTTSASRDYRALAKSLLPFLPIAIATAVLAERCIHAVLVKVGHPAGALDDSYIHFQYARAIAEGHPLRYQAGEPVTSGATSVLWPMLLAPFYLVGFRDQSIMWPAWALSFCAHALLAWEAYALAHPLAGKAAGYAAAAMVLAFAGFAWCSSSGMEVMPFAWAMARASRLAAEWSEKKEARDPKRLRWLVGMAYLAALFRPEGAITAALVALTIALFPRENTLRSRAWSLAALSAAWVTPLMLLVTTGSARSNTAIVKLLPGNPYYQGHALWEAASKNVHTLVHTLWNGEVWSAEFIPTDAAPLAFLAIAAIPIAGAQSRKYWRAGLVLAIALGMFIPCFYVTFLWNRLRYLWPFATGFFIGLSCLARVATDLAAGAWPKAKMLSPVIAGMFAGAFAVRIDWTIDDVAQSAHGIDEQHVKIGRWAKDHLPKDARIGVNDTGAIAYFSDRKTFDIVGLTTEGEAKYWVAGAASRIEHYEDLRRRAPERLPTHFIVYPEWMGTDAILGNYLYDATVTDATILGGQSMRAYEADYRMLGSGEAPWSAHAGVVDALDVADLESEASHGYELLGAHENEESVVTSLTDAGAMMLDGARSYRHRDRFTLDVKGAGAVVMRVMQTPVETPLPRTITLDFEVNGAHAGEVMVEAGDWQEKVLTLPASAQGRAVVEVRSREELAFSAFHYWSVVTTK